MHSTLHRVVLAAVVAGSATAAPIVSVAAAVPISTTSVAAVRSVGAVVALTGSAHQTITVKPAIPAVSLPTAPVMHGMLAAEVAGTGNYGAPLISGCVWATWVTNCSNLTAYGNGSGFDNVGCGPPNGCEFGPEFQCMELAVRYAYYAWGEPTDWFKYGATGGAHTMWQAGPNLPIPLAQYANGAGTPPMQGDLMIFAPGWLGSYWDGSGHVAIVRDVGPGYVDVVEENATSSGTDRFPLSGSRVTANGYTPVIGWLRETEQTPVELSASNVAGTPQGVSDQQGDMDVVWRGADSQLHDLSYRNQGWQTQPATITPADAASNPAVVSPSPGQVDAFWEDSSGNLWQVQSQAGFYGAETWLAPQELQAGALAPGSTPTAVSQSPGELEVIWKAIDGTLWAQTYDGAWSAPLPLNSGVVTGNPDAVAVSDGTIAVVWRDPSGNLWSDIGVPYGWLGAQKVGLGSLASDPTAVVAGPSMVDAVWRTTAGTVWAAPITPSGGPSQSEVDASASLGQPAAASSGSSAVTVVMQRPGGGLASAIYAPGNGWIGPQLLNEASATSVSVVNWYSNAVAAFWQGTGSSLWWSAACAGCAATPPSVYHPTG
ncbi:MAG TPA: CHAP domain-containing protein [Candidatus Acidoferrales bacterium]|nr:CHAP domain-containing protein [Candidatus Acidoferrales bacterium]